jgi:hypothetical protein
VEEIVKRAGQKIKEAKRAAGLSDKAVPKKEVAPQQKKLDPAVVLHGAESVPGWQNPTMTHAEDAKEVIVEGRGVIFGKGREQHAAEFVDMVGKLKTDPHFPPTLLKAGLRRGVTLTSQHNKWDDHWGKEYNMPGFVSAATGGGKEGLTSYDSHPMDHRNFSHEAGHQFAFEKWGTTRPPADSDYAKAQAKEPPVSEYGANSPAEDFAEASRLYSSANGRKELAAKFPLKHKALQELMK